MYRIGNKLNMSSSLTAISKKKRVRLSSAAPKITSWLLDDLSTVRNIDKSFWRTGRGCGTAGSYLPRITSYLISLGNKKD